MLGGHARLRLCFPASACHSLAPDPSRPTSVCEARREAPGVFHGGSGVQAGRGERGRKQPQLLLPTLVGPLIDHIIPQHS